MSDSSGGETGGVSPAKGATCFAAIQGLRRRAFLLIDNGERSDRRFHLALKPADRSRPNLSRRREAPVFDAPPKRRC